jgi:uncharacterized protein (DUF58 family)
VKSIRQFISSIFFNPRFFFIGAGLAIVSASGLFIPFMYFIALFLLIVFALSTVVDILMLYRIKSPLESRRIVADKFSNGDENEIEIYLSNYYPFRVDVSVVDEIPHQFQKRDVNFELTAQPGETKIIKYSLRPVKRGEYSFGFIHVFVSSPIRFISRKINFEGDKKVAVYPSFMQMRKYEFLAISNKLTMYGVKKIQRLGNNTEFEKIKEYVQGDDIRTINWKATAKKNSLMVNQYIDERAQPVYNIIDMGRTMRMPFNGLSLLDYSINSALVLSNTAIQKFDKAGIITFSHKTESVLTADRKSGQINKIMELLYKQKTGYLESNFEELYITVRRQITQRSLILLYTNFESLSSVRRQLPYLRRIADKHLLCVVFFVNTELRTFLEQPADSSEKIYEKTIAEKFDFEKRQIVKELSAYGIYSLLTEPEHLTVNAINKYLTFKAQGLI